MKHSLSIIDTDECKHCEILLDELKAFFLNRDIDRNVSLILLTAAIESDLSIYPNLKVLKISKEDIFQFGPIFPALFAVNGSGEILKKFPGYKNGVFEDALDSLNGIVSLKEE